MDMDLEPMPGIDGSEPAGGDGDRASYLAADPSAKRKPIFDEVSLDGDMICWGAHVQLTTSKCSLGFETGKAHFKNKFCAACRAGIDIPATRVRALTPQLGRALTGSLSLHIGYWKPAPPALGGGFMRVVNNTKQCVGPWLVIYQDEPPNLAWDTMPPHWFSDCSQYIPFSVAYGTPRPLNASAKAMRMRRLLEQGLKRDYAKYAGPAESDSIADDMSNDFLQSARAMEEVSFMAAARTLQQALPRSGGTYPWQTSLRRRTSAWISSTSSSRVMLRVRRRSPRGTLG